MTLRLNGSTSGYSEIEAPAVAGDQTFTLPGTGGTIVTADGTQTLTNKTVQGGVITSGTAVASTSGTAIDFTSIPSWVKRITVVFSGVSTNNTSNLLVQIGAGSVTTSGYAGAAVQATTGGNGTSSSSSGFIITGAFAASLSMSGHVFLTHLGSNTWVSSSVLSSSLGNNQNASGVVVLGGTLDRVRITSVTPDTFDAGTINILYEG